MTDWQLVYHTEGAEAVLKHFRSTPIELLDDDQLSLITDAMRIIKGPQASVDFARRLFDDTPTEGRTLNLAWTLLSVKDWNGAMTTIERLREPIRHWTFASMIKALALVGLTKCQEARAVLAEFPVTRQSTDVEFARIIVARSCNESSSVRDLLTRYDLTSEDHAFRTLFAEQALAESDMESLRKLLTFPPRPDCPMDLVARLVLARSDADWPAYRKLMHRAQDVRHLGFDAYASDWVGYCLELDGELERAKVHYLNAKQWYEQYGPREGLAHAISCLSRIAWKERQFRKALQLAKESLELDPENRVARRVRFRSYLGTWQFGKALASLGR